MSILNPFRVEERADKVTGGNPQNPSYWVEKLFGGGSDTLSGVKVDEDNVLGLSAVWCGVQVISGAVGFLPLVTYQRVGENGKTRTRTHRNYRLLHDAPNTAMNSLIWREAMQAHLLLWGNAYAEIEFGTDGAGFSLWPRMPNRVRPDVKGKEIIYILSESGKPERTVRQENMIHVKGLGFDGVKGYGLLDYAAESMGRAMAIEKFEAAFFGNGSAFGGWLEHPAQLSELAEANLRRSIESKHRGVEKAFGLGVLQEGMKYHQGGVEPEKAQLLESARFSITDVARWLDMPVHMLKELSNAHYNNIEHNAIEFVVWCLMKWLRRWELELNEKLFFEDERDEFFCEFVVEGLLRGDTLSRYQAYHTATTDGWMNRNEVRVAENRNPVPGLDEFLTPVNMAAQPDVAEEEEEEMPEEDMEEPEMTASMRAALEPLALNVCKRLVHAEVTALRKTLRKPETLLKELPAFYEKRTEFAEKLLKPILASFGNGNGKARAISEAQARTSIQAIESAIRDAPLTEYENRLMPLFHEWEAKLPFELVKLILED